MFRIDTSAYAKKHGWIDKKAGGAKVFVSQFMLMLPPNEIEGERGDEISIQHAGGKIAEHRSDGETFKTHMLVDSKALQTLISYSPPGTEGAAAVILDLVVPSLPRNDCNIFR